MGTKILSPAQMRRKDREIRVISMYEAKRADYGSVSMLYQHIADVIGCSTTTVISVLKKHGKLTSKRN